MAFFTTNDTVKINYHEYGEASAQSIVFINGYSASEITWLLQIETFVKAGYRVITYDHRNHGLSEKVGYGLTIQRLGKDLQELIGYLALEKPILIGHSMGSATIMAYEELFTDQNLKAVITEDQAPVFLKSDDWLDGQGMMWYELELFMQKLPHLKLAQKQISENTKRELGKGMLPFDFRANAGLLRSNVTQDWRAVLKREQVPHLFLAGEKSPIFPPAHAEAARALNQNSKSQAMIFEACGHILHLEDSEKYNQLVSGFLEKLV